jgi:hypothetical protein
MLRLIHSDLIYEVLIAHNGQTVRYAPPQGSAHNVAFASLFPTPPLRDIFVVMFEQANQMQPEGSSSLGLQYRGKCSYQGMTGQYHFRLMFEFNATHNVHLIRGFSLRFDF